MKNLSSLAALLLFSVLAYAQNNDGKKVELMFGKRVSFITLDNRRNILKDTVYHANDRFRVYAGYDVETLSDGKEYAIFTYPDFGRSGHQVSSTDLNDQMHLKMKDSLFLLSFIPKAEKDTLYKQILDSLLAEARKAAMRNPVHMNLDSKNGLTLAMPLKELKELQNQNLVKDVYSLEWRYATQRASGFMTIPFKLRPKQDTVKFQMTTDVTLGTYIGFKKRISRQEKNFIVIPATLGLSFINVNSNVTSNKQTQNSMVPGITASTGIVFDLNGFNIGFVLGRDFASSVGSDWIYHNKTWYSFAVGYSFFSQSSK